ncbi:Trans-aconitate 2-methyltransferase [Escovopsis weberi]|uniref:Trans-aconitate 2-methyltransferase n=1 Tax=Escovopsis weberi TaxID=150374 RepID=A0A0M8N0D2_ESCWE|nr:Trans-aconitate 2-methyltransferase [Escovopsis weberi]
MSSQPTAPGKDWSAAQYLKFDSQRTRPASDLLAQVPLQAPARIVDLGCGPGNSTQLLAARFPRAHVLGIDSSPNMIAAARAALPGAHFEVADISTYATTNTSTSTSTSTDTLEHGRADLLFSNAAMHWIPRGDRLAVFRRLVESLPPGGVLAMQVPDNHDEPSHAAMRAVAREGPWADTLARADPDIGPFHAPAELYDEMRPLCAAVDVWRTSYHHPLRSHGDIVEWVKGTGLRPYIDPLGERERDEFLARYLEELRKRYPVMRHGGVILRYPRLFMVAVR